MTITIKQAIPQSVTNNKHVAMPLTVPRRYKKSLTAHKLSNNVILEEIYRKTDRRLVITYLSKLDYDTSSRFICVEPSSTQAM